MMKYKGYVARTEVDAESGLIFGEVIGTSDMLTFEGASVSEALGAFKESVDLYLKVCAKQGRAPDKPYSGSILVRTKPSLHRKLVELAGGQGLSLNEYVERSLMSRVRRAQAKGLLPASPSESAKMAPTAKGRSKAAGPAKRVKAE
jgi:predicted HicB family RNase H-like nuclease